MFLTQSTKQGIVQNYLYDGRAVSAHHLSSTKPLEYSRDVNCISCDAKAIMSMDPVPPLPPKPLPATLSMKPYLSYELGTLNTYIFSTIYSRSSQIHLAFREKTVGNGSDQFCRKCCQKCYHLIHT